MNIPWWWWRQLLSTQKIHPHQVFRLKQGGQRNKSSPLLEKKNASREGIKIKINTKIRSWVNPSLQMTHFWAIFPDIPRFFGALINKIMAEMVGTLSLPVDNLMTTDCNAAARANLNVPIMNG